MFQDKFPKFAAIIPGIFLFANSSLAAKADTQGDSGRFKLVQLSEYARHQYLLDTKTGKIWNRVCAKMDPDGKDCRTNVWQEEEIEGITLNEQQYNAYLKRLNP